MAGVTASTTEASNSFANVEELMAVIKAVILEAGTPAVSAAGGTRLASAVASVFERTVS